MRATDETLPNPAAASGVGGDVAACDREAIHIPGSIQPHGLLLVADPATLVVVAGAGDLETRLTADWLGRPLADLIGAATAEAALAERSVRTVQPRPHVAERFDICAHRTDAHILVALEPSAAVPLAASDMLAALDAAGTLFERASDLHELAERATIAFRQLTGFERVMVYRFLEDDSGVVIAEDRDPALGSFLNHHFPASDIPVQARALYVRNRVRVIPDVDYHPAPLRPDAAAIRTADMSDVAIRSVSPLHLQYLRNMGVRASASVSIVKDGLLWGLIACHDRAPRHLGIDQRLACKALASGLARQITAKEEAETYRERIRLRASEDLVAAWLGGDTSLDDAFAEIGGDLRRMLAADGFAVLDGKNLLLSGHCPDRDDIRELAGWVRDRATAVPFATHHLARMLPSAADYADSASGLVAVTLSADEPVILMWFRAEIVQTVNWAGNPHKAVARDPDATLTPRTSFAAWSEAVHGRARRWTIAEIEGAGRLRRLLIDARQHRRLRELNGELVATIADKEALIQQKDYLLKEVNHRVQNSLQLVSAFLRLQGRAAGDPVLSGHLDEAQRRLSAVALVHRRLYSDDRVETVDLARYIEDLCGEIHGSMGQEDGNQIRLDLAPVLVATDKAVTIGLILTELVINASKYAYGGAPGPILIALEQHRHRFRLTVADQGGGKVRSRQGFGTRMLTAMVDQLSGTLEELDNQPGLRVIVSAPIEDR